jgi:hypothetical protein
MIAETPLFTARGDVRAARELADVRNPTFDELQLFGQREVLAEDDQDVLVEPAAHLVIDVEQQRRVAVLTLR